MKWKYIADTHGMHWSSLDISTLTSQPSVSFMLWQWKLKQWGGHGQILYALNFSPIAENSSGCLCSRLTLLFVNGGALHSGTALMTQKMQAGTRRAAGGKALGRPLTYAVLISSSGGL